MNPFSLRRRRGHPSQLAGLALIPALISGGFARVSNPHETSRAQETKPGEIDQYVAELLKRLPVTPGLAVAVVRGERVVYARGFGRRNLKADLPVTTRTQFYIASTTKSFTATAAKLLADEGKIDLDAPLKKYLSDLTLKAPLSAEQISLRDLLTHRSGISNEPINFRTAYTGQADAATVLRLLADYSKPVSPEFRYSNIGYVVASYAIEKVTGETWQTVVERKVLAPLGLKDTSAFASRAKASGDFALPYLSDSGTFTELPYKEDSTMHAAGGMVSSAEDLAKWLVVNMNGGRFEGRQVFPARSVEEILSPQIDQKRKFYEFERYAYSLGWNLGTYQGDKLVHCFGEFPGFRPHVSFMPAHRLGVVVLANESEESFQLPDLIASDIYDHLVHGKPLRADSNPKVEEYAADLKKKREERAKRAAARGGAQGAVEPARELAAYAGTYDSPEWGRVVVTATGGALAFKFGNVTSALKHLSGDAFEFTFFGNPSKLSFKVGTNNAVESVSVMGQTFERQK